TCPLELKYLIAFGMRKYTEKNDTIQESIVYIKKIKLLSNTIIFAFTKLFSYSICLYIFITLNFLQN
ncbi:MAG: hypothetical protein R3321_03160, partial [Nitrososphaeraceae archaeon]|nr:hypothetical protein [Nitrososphaeraceae archaeon]